MSKSNNVGRPRLTPNIPNKKFTFEDFCIANGVNVSTGKGKSCSALTLRNFLKRDKKARGKSLIVKLDEKRPPSNSKGLGRKMEVYSRRSRLTRKASHKDISVPLNDAPIAPAPVAEVAPAPVVETAAIAEVIAPVIAPEPIPAAIEIAPEPVVS